MFYHVPPTRTEFKAMNPFDRQDMFTKYPNLCQNHGTHFFNYCPDNPDQECNTLDDMAGESELLNIESKGSMYTWNKTQEAMQERERVLSLSNVTYGEDGSRIPPGAAPFIKTYSPDPKTQPSDISQLELSMEPELHKRDYNELVGEDDDDLDDDEDDCDEDYDDDEDSDWDDDDDDCDEEDLDSDDLD